VPSASSAPCSPTGSTTMPTTSSSRRHAASSRERPLLSATGIDRSLVLGGSDLPEPQKFGGAATARLYSGWRHRLKGSPKASRAGSVLESSSLASTVEVGAAHDSVRLASSESEETLAPFLDTPVSSPRPAHHSQQEDVSTTPCPPSQPATGSAPSCTSLALEGLLQRYEDSPLGHSGCRTRILANSAVVQNMSRGVVHNHHLGKNSPEVHGHAVRTGPLPLQGLATAPARVWPVLPTQAGPSSLSRCSTPAREWTAPLTWESTAASQAALNQHVISPAPMTASAVIRNPGNSPPAPPQLPMQLRDLAGGSDRPPSNSAAAQRRLLPSRRVTRAYAF